VKLGSQRNFDNLRCVLTVDLFALDTAPWYVCVCVRL